MMVFDTFKLKKKVAVVTGGAGLLGKQHAAAILEAEGIPVLLDIDGEKAKRVANELTEKYGREAIADGVDITQREEVQQAKEKILERLGQINILINNAAIDPKVKKDSDEKVWSRFEHFPETNWDMELAVGLKGAYLCSQVMGTEMAQNGGGIILNISSDLGIIAPDQRIYRQDGLPEERQPVKPVTYSVIKHGLIGLTRYLATYWAHKGVRVNALCPAGVYNNQPEDFVQKLTSLIPMGRMARIDEYKAAVLFLISDASSYMTGSVLTLDGGRSCW